MVADAKIKLDADTSSYNAKLKQANENAKKITKQHADSRKEWEKQVPLLGKINAGTLQMAAAAGAVGIAVAGIAAAWRDAERAGDAAAQKINSNLNAGKLLAQVSGSRAETQALESQARQLASIGGISIGDASQAIFDLKSAGNLGSIETVKRAALTDTDIVGSIAGAQKSAAAFGGTLDQSLQRLTRGAVTSPFSASQISSAIAVGGGTFASSGGSEAEFIGAIGGARSVKSADIGGNQLKAFARATNDRAQGMLRRFKKPGDGPVQVAQKLWEHMQERGLGLDQVGRFIKGQEAQDGFRILVENFQSGDFEERVGGIQNPGDAIGEAAGRRSALTRSTQQLQFSEAVVFEANIDRAIHENASETAANITRSIGTRRSFIGQAVLYGFRASRDALNYGEGTHSERQEALEDEMFRAELAAEAGEKKLNRQIAEDTRTQTEHMTNQAQRGSKD